MSVSIPVTPGTGRNARTFTLGTSGEFAQAVGAITGPYKCLGYERIVVSNAAVALGGSLVGAITPAGATHALIAVEATSTASDTDGLPDGIRMRQDNTAPTVTVGLLIQGGYPVEVCPVKFDSPTQDYLPALEQVKLIRAQATDMTVMVEYRAYV